MREKISVLSKMKLVGAADATEPQFLVPNNSIDNLAKKLLQNPQDEIKGPIVANSFRSLQTAANKCPHCENMAKNFLYLESLIRSNVSTKNQCSICFSALKYLQYVNKSIMQIFGNFDSVVEAARAFTSPGRDQMGLAFGQKPKIATAANKSRLSLKKSKSAKLMKKTSKHKSQIQLTRTKVRPMKPSKKVRKVPSYTRSVALEKTPANRVKRKKTKINRSKSNSRLRVLKRNTSQIKRK